MTRADDGTAVTDFPINLHRLNDPLGRDYWDGAQTGPDGTYTVSGLPAGEYEVRADARQGDLANQTYPSPVQVTEPDDTPGIDFVLGPAGRVLGRVTRVVGGVTEPLVNVRVQAEDFATGVWLSDAHTDADGDYRLEALAQGRDYRIQVRPWDHPDPQFSNFIGEYYDDRLTSEEADPVTVPEDPGQVVEVTGIDFELALGGAISGVVSGDGQPLQNVWVSADDFFGAAIGNGDHSDHNGFYVIRGLPQGSYRVQANPWPQDYAQEYFDDATAWHLATPVAVAAVPAGGPIPVTEPIDFDLAPAFRVSGRVTEADGTTPIAGLPVSLWNDEFHHSTHTGADGTWEIRGVPAGAYTATAETEGTDWIRQEQPLEVAGGDLGGVDFALRLGAVLSGRVYEDVNGNHAYDAGEERSDVDLQADDYDHGQYAASGTSGADGRYEIRGLDSGRYRVHVESGEHNFVRTYYDGVLGNWNADPVVVTEAGGVPQDVGGIDFRLVRGHEIRGFVFYDANGDGNRQPEEPGLGNVSINAELQDFQVDHVWGGTEPDGTYVLHGVYPGHHLVSAHAGGTPYASELYKLVGGLPVGTYRWSEADQVDAASGDASGIDLSLELGGGITGTVRDQATAESLANVDVRVNTFDGDGLWWGVTTDSQGRYLVNGLSPGDFRIQAWDRQGVYVGESYLDAFFSDDATPVHVAARGSLTDPLATLVDFDLAEGGALAGVVYADADGDGVRDAGEAGIGGVQIRVEEHAAPHRQFVSGTTEADGTYRVGALPPGVALRVQVQAGPTDFIGVYYDGGDDRGTLDGDQAAVVTVTAGGTQAGIDFGLAAGGALSGTVRGGDGAPLAGLWVSAQPIGSGYGSGAQTDATGLYIVHGLVPGDFRVWTGGDPYAGEYYDNQTEWRAATPVTVAAGATASGVDFILPVVPRIAGGPTPASGERGSTVTGVSVVGEQLAGAPRLEFGAGVTVQNLVLDAGGTFTFDLEIAADAPLGARALSLVNDMLLEDGAAVLANAFTVEKAESGDLPAPYTERFYTIDNGASQLRVYAGSDQTFLGAIDVCANPSALAVPGEGRFAYAGCGDRSVAVVDLRLGALGEEVARFLAVGAYNPQGLDATGAYLYAIDRETGLNRVHVVDLATWEVTAEVPVGVLPWALEIDPAGTTLWVANRIGDSLSVIDVDPASPTLHTVLATVPLPGGAQSRGLAFTPDGTRVWVVGVRDTFVVDTAARAVLTSLATPGSGRGVIAIAAHAASGKDLAFVNVAQSIWVIDASPALPAPKVLRTFAAGLTPDGVAATPDRLYVSHGASLDLYVLETAEILTGAALPLVRFDRSEAVGVPAPGAAVTPGGALAVAPVPGSPPPTAPVVSAVTGSPATNGAPFTVTVSGANFTPASMVALRGTHVRGNVLAAGATDLQVEFPAVTPAGSHPVVVSNAVAGGNESGAGSTLEVAAPSGYQPTQTFYVTTYGTGRMHVFAADGSRDVVLTQPYPGGVSITPDGRQAFVVQLHESAWSSWEEPPENSLDVSIVDLDPASPSFRQVAATVPFIWSSFASPAVTPNLDNPNGVFVYAPNRYLVDAVSVIDAVTRTEVDVDGNPDTQSIPPGDPYTDPYGQRLTGITRIELDAQITDLSLTPTDTGLTPDGTLLYVANLAGSVSIVDTVTRQVVSVLTAQGQLARASAVTVSPASAGTPAVVSVVGTDSGAVPSIFVFEAGVLDDAAAFMDQVVLPEPEVPREVGVTHDGRVYVTARFLGELWAVDLRPASWGEAAWGQIERVTLLPGIYEPAEAADDELLYVANGFRNEIYVLDLAPGHRHELITALAVPGSPGAIAVEPVVAGSDPEIGHVSPDHGSPAGGDAVLVTGVRFAAGATVELGGNPATGVVVESEFLIRAVTPAGAAGAADVKVTNPDHRFGLLAGGFTYADDTAPPVFITPPYVAGQTLAGAPGSQTATAETRWRTDEASTSVVDYRRAGDAVFLQASDPALVTDHRITLAGLEPATGYEYRATSADAGGNTASSPAAPAVETFTTLAAPDVTPPVIVSGPVLASVSTTSATLQWETDETATSVLQYDAQLDGHPDLQAFGPDGTLHSVTLTGLAAGARYEYKALSVDAGGNGPAASALDFFDTDSLPDATPPAITLGPDVLYLANDLVAIYWVTDVASTSFVNYGTASIDEAGVVDVDKVLSHVVFLTNLLPNTAYGYQVGSQDAAGNTVLSADPFESLTLQPPGIFKLSHSLEAGRVALRAGTTLNRLEAADGFTTPATPDTTPPQALAHGVTPLSSDRVLVSVEADEAASLAVRWGVGGLTTTAFAPTYSRAPSVVLTGLVADTTYQLELELTDPKGNAAVVGGLTFTTPAAPDVASPVLSAVTVAAVTGTSAHLTWQTDEPADATLRAGARQIGRLGLATSHSLLLTGLEPSTAYAFEAASRDAGGNVGTAAGTFSTSAAAPLVSSVLPPRAAQGATVDVVVNGAHFGADVQVGFGTGVTVDAMAVNAAGSQLRATITVAPTAAVGPRQVTVTTNGYTVTAPFAVVDASLPVVTITEPQDGAELPALTVVVRGTLSEDADVTVNGVEAAVTPGAPITFEATVTLPATGQNRIVATAVDASGNRGTAVVVLTVALSDTTPPVLKLEATPAVLWPPNHKMVPVVVDVQVADDQDPSPAVALVSVTSNEPDDAPGGGDGNTVNDVQGADLGTDDREVLLRAERSDSGTGRVYTLVYRATDEAGNAGEASVEVEVPRSQGKPKTP